MFYFNIIKIFIFIKKSLMCISFFFLNIKYRERLLRYCIYFGEFLSSTFAIFFSSFSLIGLKDAIKVIILIIYLFVCYISYLYNSFYISIIKH